MNLNSVIVNMVKPMVRKKLGEPVETAYFEFYKGQAEFKISGKTEENHEIVGFGQMDSENIFYEQALKHADKLGIDKEQIDCVKVHFDFKNKKMQTKFFYCDSKGNKLSQTI